MNRWDELMDEFYFEVSGEESMTEEEQARVLQAALHGKHQRGRKKMSKKKFITILAAAAISVTALTAGAVNLFKLDERIAQMLGPVNDKQIRSIEQAGTALNQSVTDNGWTMQLTGAFGDTHSAYVVFQMIAPEGTVLDGDAYRFEMPFVMLPDTYNMGYSVDTIEDDNKTDNIVTFVLQLDSDASLSGNTLRFDFQNLQLVSSEPVTIAEGRWQTEFELNYRDESISLPAGKQITLDNEPVTVEKLLVSPLGVSVEIKGDYIARYDQQPPEEGSTLAVDLTLHFTDGSTLRYDSSYSGPDDALQAGSGIKENKMTQSVSFRHLIRFDALESIDVAGVSFPVK